MSNIRRIEGRLDGTGKRFAIVAARFNSRLVEALEDGALDCLERHGVAPADIQLVRVPGVWEIPQALEELALAQAADGLVALGVVIRGETPHFDYLCSQCSRGISRIVAQYRVPVGFGVLTCDNPHQAQERSGGKAGNKGWDAALATLEMTSLLSGLRTSDSGE